jgi:4-hydroxy-tetrahydrodipicolinate reductase
MDILLIGYGRMGRLIEARALEKGHRITAIVDPFVGAASTVSGAPVFTEPHEALRASVAIEFTRPDTALANIKAAAALKIPIVVGTTGWYEHLDEVRALVAERETALLWSPNFSIGVTLFYTIVENAAALLDPFAEYDVAGFEAHHNRKADSPSGTAKTLAARVLAAMTRKKRVVWDRLQRQPETDELHFASLRAGAIPGTHSILFDSPADTIEIRHTARGREGFASGALRAAEWLVNEDGGKRRGVFTLEDVLGHTGGGDKSG